MYPLRYVDTVLVERKDRHVCFSSINSQFPLWHRAKPSCRVIDLLTRFGFQLSKMGHLGTFDQNAMSPIYTTVLYDRHSTRESDLTIKVNLKRVLPHKKQLQLISIDPELLDYPIMKISAPSDLHRCIKDIKDYICNMLWNTLSISINPTSFRFSLDTYHSGKQNSARGSGGSFKSIFIEFFFDDANKHGICWLFRNG